MSRAIRYLGGLCRGLTALLLLPVLFLVVTAVPMLFGYMPIGVTESDNGIYPAETLAFSRFVLAENLLPGDFVAVEQDVGEKVCAVLSIDVSARSVQTAEEAVPFERIRGKLADFKMQKLGAVLRFLHQPICLTVLCGLLVLSGLGGFLLPKIVYAPRFGR